MSEDIKEYRGETKVEAKHTPTPWHFDRNKDGHLWITDSRNNIGIGRLSNPRDSSDEANAAFIVRAVNSHDQLMDAIAHALAVLGEIPATGDDIGEKVTKAQLGIIHRELCRAITSGGGKPC